MRKYGSNYWWGVTMMLVIMAAVAHGQQSEPLRVEQSGLAVRLVGVTKPQVDDVRAVVTEQLTLTDDRVASPPLADDMAFFVLQRYLELGFKEAKVDWTIGSSEVLLTVIEGRMFVVGEVTYLGEVGVTEEELTRYLLRPTHEKLRDNSEHPPFVEADIESGVGQVQRYLQGQGYLDAVVSEPTFTVNEAEGNVSVLLRVKQGRRYVVGSVSVQGGLAENGREEHEILEGLGGQPFNEVKVEDLRKSLVDLYQQQGHFGVVVTARADAKRLVRGQVPVHYAIVPGPIFSVADIQISPQFSKGAGRLIRASYRRAIGKTYIPSDLEILHRRLLDTEVFGQLEVTPRQVGPNQVALDLAGMEAKRITLSAYAGYETFLGPVAGVEARQVNIFNWGDTIRVKAEGTARGFNGGVLWLDPAIFNSAQSLEAEASADTFEIFDYNRRTLSLRTALGRQWNRHLSAKAFVEYSLNEVESDIPEDIPFLGKLDYQLLNVGATLLVDFRDSPVLPTKGWMSSFTVTSGLGEVGFLRSDLLFSVYQPLGRKFRVAAHARTSSIQTDDPIDEFPIDQRLFNGGANSVRSFQEREMGQKTEAGTPLGGTLSQVFSVEFSYAMSPNFELALFGDAGSLSRIEDEVLSWEGEFRYAVGLGFRYKLPIGPLRVDYGYNPDRQEGDPMGALHITFGFPF